MDKATGTLVDGTGTAAATSGVLSQLQGRIFALLYLEQRPLALEAIAAELGQSKSNVSVNIRGLIEWHLVRLVPVAGSRKDHYEAETNFWRVMQEILERRFRWTVRQMLTSIVEAERALAEEGGRRETKDFVAARLSVLHAFFAAIDVGIGAFTQGQPLDPGLLKSVESPASRRPRPRGPGARR